MAVVVQETTFKLNRRILIPCLVLLAAATPLVTKAVVLGVNNLLYPGVPADAFMHFSPLYEHLTKPLSYNLHNMLNLNIHKTTELFAYFNNFDWTFRIALLGLTGVAIRIIYKAKE